MYLLVVVVEMRHSLVVTTANTVMMESHPELPSCVPRSLVLAQAGKLLQLYLSSSMISYCRPLYYFDPLRLTLTAAQVTDRIADLQTNLTQAKETYGAVNVAVNQQQAQIDEQKFQKDEQKDEINRQISILIFILVRFAHFLSKVSAVMTLWRLRMDDL
jgi:hypothetical protein